MDIDNSGSVSAEELRWIFESSGTCLSRNKETIDQIISECDKNGDGVIDYKEFIAGVSQV